LIETSDQAIRSDERALGTFAVFLGPLLFATACAGLTHLVGAAEGGDAAHFAGLSLGWFAGTTVVARWLRRRWSNSRYPSSSDLFLAAAASFATMMTAVILSAPWQDLMSEPEPTPLMVIKDVTATCAPLLAGVLAPWCVLSRRRPDEDRT